MSRIISPPKNELNKLKQQLRSGEKLVFDFFDRHLSEDWEIYIQPHLNGLRPDFVLLNPNSGIAVFEIKDWNLNSMDYFIKNQSGKKPILMAKKDGKEFSKQKDNPVEKVYRYKQEIYDLYCPRLKQQSGLALITAGIIFPFEDGATVKSLFSSSLDYRGMLKYEKYHPISGRDALQSGNLKEVFPEGARSSSYYMNSDLAQDLRNWLVEPDFSATQRRKPELDETQMNFVTTRTTTGYRRIKGPAGSGKSIILAGRAVQLASECKDVLVVTYNITLLHYLRDVASRWKSKDNKNSQGNITWLNFHKWCKRVSLENGYDEEYKAIWKRHNIQEDKLILTNKDITGPLIEISQLANSIINGNHEESVQKYDAILVDEGQDFLPEWWNILRKVCKNGGEMLLVADATQDIFGTAKSWTDVAMIGAGFVGDWAELQFSYRMPPKLIGYARDFVKQFLTEELSVLPYNPQTELDTYPCKLRWVQTSEDKAIKICEEEVLSLAPSIDPNILSMSDITLLVTNNKFGLEITNNINNKGVNFVHTFSENNKISQRKKHGFYMGDARLKSTTLHSFKGWESTALVVYIGHKNDVRAMHLVYTGMTRLKRSENISMITIVSAIKELENYGKTWPEFEYK